MLATELVGVLRWCCHADHEAVNDLKAMITSRLTAERVAKDWMARA